MDSNGLPMDWNGRKPTYAMKYQREDDQYILTGQPSILTNQFELCLHVSVR